jgi:glycerophosphoryl diester phosphodiesterase
MIITLIILSCAAAAALIYLWLIRPDPRRKKDVLFYSRWHFAHRGLWDMKDGIPENSLPAFRRAVERGYAIELDVHLTADGQMVVFHDDSLQRMCGTDRTVESMTCSELSGLRLLHTGHRIPLLSEVLALVDGRVPLLIEMKLPSKDLRLCPLLDSLLRGYSGPCLIESFNPFGLRWFRKHRPDILRGQLASRYAPSSGMDAFLKKMSTALIVNCVSRPHFLAYNYRSADGLGIRLNRNLYRIPVFAWTIRSPEDFQACEKQFSALIFEGFLPVCTRR